MRDSNPNNVSSTKLPLGIGKYIETEKLLFNLKASQHEKQEKASKAIKERTMKVFRGKLTHFFETGSEGTYWVLKQSDNNDVKELIFLRTGDELTIRDENGAVVFNGLIAEDRSINLQRRPSTQVMQPVSKGHWVQWLQPGVDPDVWGYWFMSGKFEGILVRQ